MLVLHDHRVTHIALARVCVDQLELILCFPLTVTQFNET